MSRGKRITVETLEKIITLSNAGLKSGEISSILNGISRRSIDAYVICIRSAERGEKTCYSSKMVGEKTIKEYCKKHGLTPPTMEYFQKRQEQIQIEDMCQTFGRDGTDIEQTPINKVVDAVDCLIEDLKELKDALNFIKDYSNGKDR